MGLLLESRRQKLQANSERWSKCNSIQVSVNMSKLRTFDPEQGSGRPGEVRGDGTLGILRDEMTLPG